MLKQNSLVLISHKVKKILNSDNEEEKDQC